jgi:hypothetical protein
MKKTFTISVAFSTTILFGISCTNNSTKKEEPLEKPKQEKPLLTKPPSSYQDTLLIDKTAAVFYHPDSMQLEKIKKIEDSMVYEGTMHEYFYQMRNSRIVIKKSWPNIKIIEANNVRYLLFKKKNNETTTIDLDTKGDPHGLFLFDQKHDPELADMMNIDNELPRYFYQK